MLAIYQNIKSFITIKPEEMISTGFAKCLQGGSCGELEMLLVETRGFVWILQERYLAGSSGDHQMDHKIPDSSHLSLMHCSSPCVVFSHRQKAWVYNWLGKIPQCVFRTRSGEGGRNGIGESFPRRTVGHTPSEYYVFMENARNEQRELPNPTGMILSHKTGDLESKEYSQQ